jgi:vancomycin permeability regulator SanA
MKKKLWITGLILALLAVCGGVLMLGVNGYVVLSTKNQILLSSEAAELPDVDCILVLGCRVYEDGTPSHMLEDRLRRSVELYRAGAAPKLLMSGDHGQREYDEVGAMKQYALAEGVSSQDVFMDHAGFSTYESLYRAKEIFGVEKVIIVTQEYHLHRALQIARALGLEAYGVSADYRSYTGQLMRDIREIMARNKDVLSTIFLPKPTYLGEKIPISGDGDVTNDEKWAY